jgi:hypothetical protein
MNITRAIEEVNKRTLRKVARNMVKRVDKCIEMDIISNTYCKYRLVVYYNMLQILVNKLLILK